MDYVLMAGLGVIFAGVLFCFFRTKAKGFGPYNTSTLIVILVLLVTSAAFMSGKLPGDDLSKILFALIGFASGMFTAGKEPERDKKSNEQRSPLDGIIHE